MDPLSIITSVLALAGHCVKGLDIIHQYSSEFQRAELNVRLLSTECRTLATILGELSRLHMNNRAVHGGPPGPDARPQDDAISLVLSECKQQLKILMEKLEPFIELASAAKPDEMTMRARISATWNRGDIDIPRQCIQRQVVLINLLLTTLQHESIMRLGDIINGSPAIQELLKRSKDDTKSLRTTHEKEKSLFYAGVRSGSGPRSTIGTTAESIIGDEEFTFDTQLINTAAYRRVLQSHQRATSDQGQSSQVSGPSVSTSTSGPSHPRLSRLFGKSAKKDEAGTPSSSTMNANSPGQLQELKTQTRHVEPSSETIIMDQEHGMVTAKDVRDARNMFYAAMALHREILAMKFVDKSYKGVLEEKMARRDAIINKLWQTCMLWDFENKFDKSEESEIVKELVSVLLPRLMISLEKKKPGPDNSM